MSITLRKSPERQFWNYAVWKGLGRSKEIAFVCLIPPMPKGTGLRNAVTALHQFLLSRVTCKASTFFGHKKSWTDWFAAAFGSTFYTFPYLILFSLVCSILSGLLWVGTCCHSSAREKEIRGFAGCFLVDQETCAVGIHLWNVFPLPAHTVCVDTDRKQIWENPTSNLTAPHGPATAASSVWASFLLLVNHWHVATTAHLFAYLTLIKIKKN